MEKIQLFSIFDKVGKRFDGIMMYPNRAIAIRDITSKTQDNPKTALARFPEDFKLVKLGEYDFKTGLIESKLEEICEITEICPKNEEIKVVKDEKN